MTNNISLHQNHIGKDWIIKSFKNISEEKKAWMLIKQSGCENLKEGDALISKKHCNFFVNNGNAKASDIEKLINKVKKQVHHKTGVNLDLEIKIIDIEKGEITS